MSNLYCYVGTAPRPEQYFIYGLMIALEPKQLRFPAEYRWPEPKKLSLGFIHRASALLGGFRIAVANYDHVLGLGNVHNVTPLTPSMFSARGQPLTRGQFQCEVPLT